MQKKTITKTGMSYINSPTTDLYGTLNLWVTQNLYLPVIAKYTVDIHRGDRSELLLYFSCDSTKRWQSDKANHGRYVRNMQICMYVTINIHT